MKKTKKTIPIVRRIQMFLEQPLLKKQTPNEIPENSGPGDGTSIHSREKEGKEEAEEEKDGKNSHQEVP